MNRTDRLLAIVLELQAKKQLRAEDLAAIFELTKRTIYRDMQALSEMGVPIISVTGQGYSLVEGYFLPPLSFNTDEAIILLLGADFLAQNFDAQYRLAAQSASQKILTVLSDKLRHEVEYLQSSIRFINLNETSSPESLQKLRRAIIQGKTVRFRYHGRYGDKNAAETQIRETDPYALIHIGGAWMLIAYCHLRKDKRHFRLERMEEILISDKFFKRPSDFKIQLGNEDNRTLEVQALFEPSIAPRVEEAPSGFQIAQERQANGLLVTFLVRNPEDILAWMLSWGSRVKVLKPESLIELIKREAEAILENHSIR